MKLIKLIFADRRMLITFLLGFVGGLPLLLTGSTLQAWCKEAGMDLTSIGLLALVGVPYTVKFLWSPLLDWLVPPFLGRRRGWLVISQLGLIAALVGMAVSQPQITPLWLVASAFAVAALSATQDIAIDAYIIEILEPEIYGLGTQVYIVGYRIGMLLAGAGSLILADRMPWRSVYLVMALAMTAGLITTWLAPEPRGTGRPPRSLVEAVWHPLRDFFSEQGSLQGRVWWVFAFLMLYKIGGDMATAMTVPLYKDLGFSNTEIGSVAKIFAPTATIIGGLIGGGAVVYMGLKRSLWIFGVVQGLATLSFAWLAASTQAAGRNSSHGASIASLATAITIEYLASGLGTAAYTTLMGSLVNRRFTATQYAILSSLMGMPRVFGAAATGWLADKLGWFNFFVFCALAALPGLLILLKITPPENAAETEDPLDSPPTEFLDVPQASPQKPTELPEATL